MITPKEFIESFESYRTGDKNFCKLATVSNKENGIKKYFGFWIEVITNDTKLVLSIQFKSLTSNEPVFTKFFFGRDHLKTFVEDARQHVSGELERMLSSEEA